MPEIHLPSQDQMLAAVGRGIQAFAAVELGVSWVFASLMEPASRDDSIVALDAARHIETKMRIVRAVAQRQLEGETGAEFNNLFNRIKRRSDFRHKLAHWTVSHWPGMMEIEKLDKVEVVLAPPPASPGYISTLWGDDPPIRMPEIEDFTTKCHELASSLIKLAGVINASKSGGEQTVYIEF